MSVTESGDTSNRFADRLIKFGLASKNDHLFCAFPDNIVMSIAHSSVSAMFVSLIVCCRWREEEEAGTRGLLMWSRLCIVKED